MANTLKKSINENASLIQFPNKGYKPTKLKQFRFETKTRNTLLQKHELDGFGGARIRDWELAKLEKSFNTEAYKPYKKKLNNRVTMPLADNLVFLHVERIRKST